VSTEHPVGSPREEAERLLAAGLGAASMALQGVEAKRQLRAVAEQLLGADRLQDLAAGLGGFAGGTTPGRAPGSTPTDGSGPASGADAPTSGASAAASGSPGLSTGSADCCVCPVCRLIAALRDPSPEFAEQLATAAGDLAVGMTGLLRAFSGALSRTGQERSGDAWSAATTAPGPDAPPQRPDAPPQQPDPAPAPDATPPGTGGPPVPPPRAGAGDDSDSLGSMTPDPVSHSPRSEKGAGSAHRPAPARKTMAKKAVRKVAAEEPGAKA